MTDAVVPRWVVLVVRVPAAPSRHQVAVWRELRRMGAVSLGQGSWAVPDVPAFAEGITRVIGKGKFTLAELEEEEQSLERLRRWHRDLKARDVFGAPATVEADQQLKHCTERLEDYTERVFAALHQM